MNSSRGNIGIISCKAGEVFANKVINELSNLIGEENSSKLKVHSKESWFSNGEVKTEIEDNARNSDIYIIQDVGNNSIMSNGKLLSINDHYMALKTAIDSARLADAHYITAVLPLFPYSRQDRRKSREGITSKLIARELELAGAKRILTLDIHNESTEGFFDRSTSENLRASKCLIPHIRNNILPEDLEKLVVVAPDVGAVGRNEYFALDFGCSLGMVYKKRNYSKTNTIENLTLLGDVKGSDILIVDDMIDTAGTILSVAKLIKDNGAKNIHLATSLAILSGSANEKLNKAYSEKLISGLYATDAIYKKPDFSIEHPWYKEVSVAELFAKAIYNINSGESIRALNN